MSTSPLYLLHSTSPEGFENIIRSNKLISPRTLNIKTSSEQPDVIWFTPTYGVGITVPQTTSSPMFYFSSEILLGKRFFANEGNAFDIRYGEPRKNGNCKCKRSFINFTTEQKKGKCYKNTLKELLDETDISFDECDGGPEIGVITEYILLDNLLFISMHKRHYENLSDDIKSVLRIVENTNDIYVLHLIRPKTIKRTQSQSSIKSIRTRSLSKSKTSKRQRFLSARSLSKSKTSKTSKRRQSV